MYVLNTIRQGNLRFLTFVNMRAALSIALLLFSLAAFSQKDDREIIQFSGVTVDADALTGVPLVTIIVENTGRGTISDNSGYFSFVAQVLDTIRFSSVGYKKAWFIIPDTLSNNRYSLIQMMTRDTVLLKETAIYPWPSKDQFRDAFMNLVIADDDYERARKNLAREELAERGEAMAMDGSQNYKYQMQAYQSKLYYAGQYPPNNLLNPLAWYKFIQAWKRGDFRRKDKKNKK